MKKKILAKAPAVHINKDSLILELDEDRNWTVKMLDNNGYIIESKVKYNENELENNFDLNIKIHDDFYVEEEEY